MHGVLLDDDDDDARSQNRDDVRALIEFFKNTAPPESNFMSKPFENEDDRGRWSTLKGISKRRSKSMSRVAQPIRLPDSAVSGTTTGGHRHIAISIPMEASPFGERSRSQYPTYPDYEIHNDIPPVPTPPKQVIRTYVNEKGVITVMRAVADEHDAKPEHAPLASPPLSAASSRPTSEHRSFSRPQSQQSKSNLRTRRRDTASPPPPLAERPHLRDRSRTVSFEDAKNAGTDIPETPPLPSPSSEFRRTAYPARGSSMAAARRAHRPTDSIDSIISHGYQDRNPSPIPPSSQPQRRGAARRPGTREGPPVSLATSPIGRKSNPNLRGERQPEDRLSFEPVVPTKRASNVTIITDTPVVTQLKDSPPLTPVSVVSRKDKVRDKRRRDLEAARLARDSMQQSQLEPAEDGRPVSAVPDKQVPSSGPKLTGIMVVVDVEPDVEPEVESAAEAEVDTEAEPVPELESESESKPESIVEYEIVKNDVPDRQTQSPSPQPSELNLDEPGPLVYTGNPTPPDSTKNSPAQRFGFDDRTSLTRRREWNASREQERKRREAEKVNAKAKQLAAAGMSYERIKALNPEEKMVKLYEAYREHRMLDIDRRLRRLERNGDVWVQALLPLLDNMNRNMEAMNNRHEDEMLLRDCASDDEASASFDKLDRKLERRRLTRRASLSQGRMLEEMSRREKAASWDNADSGKMEDASGLGALDSIMRELAAESRFGKSGMQSFSGNDGVFAN